MALFGSLGKNRYWRALVNKFTSSAPWFWHFLQGLPLVSNWVNRIFIDTIASSAPARPHPFSLWGPGEGGINKHRAAGYISWTGLTDRRFTNRQLPVAAPDYELKLPPVEKLGDLFRRNNNTVIACTRSSALFGFFAQWLTDSFLRTDSYDWRKNTSNHELDLCQVYGLHDSDTHTLRSHLGGKLTSVFIKANGVVEEYPPFLLNPDGKTVADQFLGLTFIDPKTKFFSDPGVLQLINTPPFDDPARRRLLFAAGLERGNSSIIYSALNILFLREHNRLCDELATINATWDDDRLFETARNINIAQYLRIIVEDYIAHIAPTHFKMFVEPGWAEKKRWYRTNRISAEFNLLYRWHQLIPEHLSDGTTVLKQEQYRFNNKEILDRGLDFCFSLASKQGAGAISLQNTADFLVQADVNAVVKSRSWAIQSYQAYRDHFGMPKMRTFEELTGEKKGPDTLAAKLEALYKKVENVELLIGLLAEKRDQRDVLAALMTLMVGYDAFSHALTNPLLSERVFRPIAFSDHGLASIQTTKKLSHLLERNSAAKDLPEKDILCEFNCAQEIPGNYGPPLLKKIYDTADFFFISGWRKFLERRRDKYKSSVYRVNLFKRTVVALDHGAIYPLFGSPKLKQDYGFSWAIPALSLVGHEVPSIFEAGDLHDKPKELYLQMLRGVAGDFEKAYAEVSAAFVAKWQAQKIFSFRDEIEDFAIRLIYRLFLGLNLDDQTSKDIRLVYLNIFNHILPKWLLRLNPRSTYSKSLAIYPGLLAKIKAAPKFAAIDAAAKTLELKQTNDYVAKQIAFLLGMNSFLGTQNFLKSIVGELTLHPELAEPIRAEFAAGAPMLKSQREGFLCEILRLHPPVFFIFGRATERQKIQSASGAFILEKDELLMGSIALAHRDPRSFKDPETFDHTRFSSEKARSRLIWPRGGHDSKITRTDRTCPGRDIALLIAERFLATLLNNDWTLADPTVTWSGKKFTLNVAAPEGDLKTASFGPRVAKAQPRT